MMRISQVGKAAVASLSSLLPAASVVKNTMTIYTLFVVLIAMMIAFPLFYVNNGLFALLSNFGHLKQPVFIYAVAFYITLSYTVFYSLASEEFAWERDDQLRNQVIFPPCIIFVTCMIISIKGYEIPLYYGLICDILGRQICVLFNHAFSVFYAVVNGPQDKYYYVLHSSNGKLEIGRIISSYLIGVFISVLASLISTILSFVAIIPVSLSFLDLNEVEKLSIYGIIFPIISLLMDYGVHLLEKAGLFNNNPQGLTNLKFTASLATALYFSLSPLFCMLFLSPDPLSFAITYIPHAFFSKLMWVRHIPQVKAFFAKKSAPFLRVICLVRERVIVQKGNQSETTTTDNALSDEERNRIKEGERKKKAEESRSICNGAGIQESADLVGTKVAIILVVMRLCSLCFFQSGSNNNNSAISFDEFKNLLINVFCIILPIDQISAILGFALLAQSGHPVDANFHLDINPLNPIRTWRNGNTFKAIGGLSFCVFFIISICCAIAIGTNGPLF